MPFQWLGLDLCCMLAFCQAHSSQLRPCTNQIRENCSEGRFVPCGSTKNRHHDFSMLHARDATKCHAPAGRVQPGQMILVEFFSGPPDVQNGKCMEILLVVGECWGLDSDGDSYDCLGLCGVGCQESDVCSNWSRNCLKHDVCSYYYNSRGGAADPHCGWAFNIAASDFLQPCAVDSACTLPNFNRKAEVCTKAAGSGERVV